MADDDRVVLTPKPRVPALVSRSVMVAALALAGCGGSQSKGDPPQPPPEPTSPPQDAQPVDEPPPQPAPEEPPPTDVPPQVPPQF